MDRHLTILFLKEEKADKCLQGVCVRVKPKPTFVLFLDALVSLDFTLVSERVS